MFKLPRDVLRRAGKSIDFAEVAQKSRVVRATDGFRHRYAFKVCRYLPAKRPKHVAAYLFQRKRIECPRRRALRYGSPFGKNNAAVSQLIIRLRNLCKLVDDAVECRNARTQSLLHQLKTDRRRFPAKTGAV